MKEKEIVDELVAYIHCLLDGKTAEVKIEDWEKAKSKTVLLKKNMESGTILLKPFEN